MPKKIIIALVLILVIISSAVYIYRYAIIKHYAEKIVRENLPEYIKIDGINFDFTGNKISLSNFRILNPPGFSSQFLIKINDISCRYGITGKVIPRGIEISDVSLNGADIRIERLKDNRINIIEEGQFIKSFPAKGSQSPIPNPQPHKVRSAPQLLSDLIKLPQSFKLKGSKLVFLDRVPYDNPYITTIEQVAGEFSPGFSDNYSKITGLSFTLSGRLNGYEKESIQWVASLSPEAPGLTMSNRLNVSGLNILTFEPYYDKFSPFTFKKGRFSGELVLDFNNGNIGSTNEIYLSGIDFSVKPDCENTQFWDTTVPDLARYFTTTSGDIVFDFKIKGDMGHPAFYLGPISKRAVTSMIIDKIASYASGKAVRQEDGAGSGIDKAKDTVDMIKQFLKKK